MNLERILGLQYMGGGRKEFLREGLFQNTDNKFSLRQILIFKKISRNIYNRKSSFAQIKFPLEMFINDFSLRTLLKWK